MPSIVNNTSHHETGLSQKKKKTKISNVNTANQPLYLNSSNTNHRIKTYK